jgi:hypothetical protein
LIWGGKLQNCVVIDQITTAQAVLIHNKSGWHRVGDFTGNNKQVMKKGLLACLITSIIIWNPRCARPDNNRDDFQSTFIKGKISPAEAAKVVWIMDSKDTLATSIIDGSFSMKVRPETYKLVVNAKPPYGNVSLDNLEVKQYHALDVGEIILQQ